MEFRALSIPGAYEIQLQPIRDARGHFTRTYDKGLVTQQGLQTDWVQENESGNHQAGVLRGLHFQNPPHAQTKLVRALVGAILDVFVDIRRSSPAFGKYEMVELSAERANAVYIPKGCAHAYLTLTDETLVAYKMDSTYAPHAEGGILWNDPALAIPWPLRGQPVLSEKDSRWPNWATFRTPFD